MLGAFGFQPCLAEVMNSGESNGSDRTSVVRVCFPDLDSSLPVRGQGTEKVSAEGRSRPFASAAGDQSASVGQGVRPEARWLMASSAERIARERSADAVTEGNRLVDSGLEYGRVTVVRRPSQVENVIPDMVIDTVSRSRIMEERVTRSPEMSALNTASQAPMSRVLGMR